MSVHRLVRKGEQLREEPVRHDGEPYRSSYSALYRLLSMYEVHGSGPIQGWVDLDRRTLRAWRWHNDRLSSIIDEC
jgi:hypothetical protein